MLIKTLPVGHLETNCYILTDENTLECAVIDPGDESGTILDYVESNRLSVRAILLTHGHFDHTGAVEAVAEETGAPVWIAPADVCGAEDRSEYKYLPGREVRPLQDGTEIPIGTLTVTAVATPGHTPGGMTFRCRDALFAGDTLFRDSCGRTDLPGGDMSVLLGSLRRLAALPGDYEVYPGHMESTTLDRERNFNYYMRYALENR